LSLKKTKLKSHSCPCCPTLYSKIVTSQFFFFFRSTTAFPQGNHENQSYWFPLSCCFPNIIHIYSQMGYSLAINRFFKYPKNESNNRYYEESLYFMHFAFYLYSLENPIFAKSILFAMIILKNSYQHYKLEKDMIFIRSI
jgi:hypothetical protein